MKQHNLYICVGTRADIIKMHPIITELRNSKFLELFVCLSGQHSFLANSIIEEFNLKFDCNFNIMKDSQSLDYILSILINKFTDKMKQVAPNYVLIHGDTTTALAGALAASYLKIPIIHIEAGLRTYSDVPFPEELNRRLISVCTKYFMCPSVANAKNLISENVDESYVYVTGNSIVDVLCESIQDEYIFENETIKNIDFSIVKVIVVTIHRREKTKSELINICKAIKNAASLLKDSIIVWSVHPNPRIKNVVYEEMAIENVILTESLKVKDMHNLIFKADLIITDSGGVQEEAYYLNKPSLIIRDNTERMDCFNDSISKILNPNSSNLADEILNFICASPKTDNNLGLYKIHSLEGASKKIVNHISDILNFKFEKR